MPVAIKIKIFCFNLDVKKIYESELKFKYTPKTGDWKKQFAPGPSQYKEERKWKYKVVVTEYYAKLHKIDAQLLRYPIAGEEMIVDSDRLEKLLHHPRFGKLVELVDKIKEE